MFSVGYFDNILYMLKMYCCKTMYTNGKVNKLLVNFDLAQPLIKLQKP
jgi:hypothetical protein